MVVVMVAAGIGRGLVEDVNEDTKRFSCTSITVTASTRIKGVQQQQEYRSRKLPKKPGNKVLLVAR